MTLTIDERCLLRVVLKREIDHERGELDAARDRLRKHDDDKYRKMDADNIAWSEQRIAELSDLLKKISSVGM